MADRRMIHKKISLSEQFNDLSEFAQLLFALMIPHADDWGVLKGSPRVIRGMVIPLNDKRTDEDVDAALNEMVEQRLIWRYAPDSEGPMLQFRKWEDHQTGLHKRTRPKQKLYYYPGQARQLLEKDGITWDYREFHTDSEKFQEIPGNSPRTEGNRTEQNGTEGKESPQPFSQIFTEETGVLIATGKQAQEMNAWMEDVSEDWFRAACKEAADNNARKWSYVRAILERWKAEGRQSKRGKVKRGSKGAYHSEHDEAAKERERSRRRKSGDEAG